MADDPWAEFRAKKGADPWAEFRAKPTQTSLGDRAKQFGGGLVKGLIGTAEFAERMLSRDAQLNPDDPTRPSKVAVEKTEQAFPTPKDLPGRVIQGVGEAMGSPTSYVGPGGIIAKLIAAGGSGAGSAVGEAVGGKAGAVAGSMLGGLAGWTKLKITPNLQFEAKNLYRGAQTPEEFHLLDAIILGDESRASKLQIVSALKNVLGPTWTAAKFVARPSATKALDAAIDLVLKRIQARALGQPTTEKLKELISKNQQKGLDRTLRAGRAGVREAGQQYGGVE